MSDSPIEICTSCGTPKLDKAPHTLVLYFDTREGLLEFKELFEKLKPNLKSYEV